MKRTIEIFGNYQKGNPGMDGALLLFPFIVRDSDSAEKASLTENHQIAVSIADTRRRAWHISKDDVPALLFEFAKNYIKQRVELNSLPKENTVTMPMITNVSHPEECPFQISSVQLPDEFVMDVEVKGEHQC